jgi:hypothetical protein
MCAPRHDRDAASRKSVIRFGALIMVVSPRRSQSICCGAATGEAKRL